MAVASTPWSGAYTINPALWGYAHVGQFTKTGWKYLDAASGNLTGGGNFVTMVAPSGGDFSVIAQTEGANAAQNITFNVTGGLSTGTVSVWRSNATAQFQQQPNVTPANGSFTISLDANSIYSITTTTGQQKGATASPAAASFPFPYYETYDHYGNAQSVGYRPYYHADIAGGFELFARPDGTGQCLRQVISQPAQSWAPETNPYTIVGDTGWTNYEVSADVSIETTSGWASLLGRVGSTGTGYGTNPNGYIMTLSPTGAYNLYAATTTSSTATTLSTGQATLAAGSWHTMKLVFQGTSIKGLLDGTQVFSVTDSKYSKGSVGLGTAAKTTALFDNLIVNTVGGTKPSPTVFAQDGQTPPDAGANTDLPVLVPDAGAKDVAASPDSNNRDAVIAADLPSSTSTGGTSGGAGGTSATTSATGGTMGARGGATASIGGTSGATGGTTGSAGGTAGEIANNGGAIGGGTASGEGGSAMGGATSGGGTATTAAGNNGCSCSLGRLAGDFHAGGIAFFAFALAISMGWRKRRKRI